MRLLHHQTANRAVLDKAEGLDWEYKHGCNHRKTMAYAPADCTVRLLGAFSWTSSVRKRII
jgi:hypothetical protein